MSLNVGWNVNQFRSVVTASGNQDRTRILSEGDSWFHLPTAALSQQDGTNIIDWLTKEKETANSQKLRFNILRMEFSGDEAAYMLSQGQRHKLARTFSSLCALHEKQAAKKIGFIPDYILFSAGGNDIAGEFDFDHFLLDWQEVKTMIEAKEGPLDLAGFDESNGADVKKLDKLAASCINPAFFDIRLRQIMIAYEELAALRDGIFGKITGAKKVPWILTHGYDYPLPSKKSSWFILLGKQGPWMLPALEKKGYKAKGNPGVKKVQRAIARFMIKTLNKRLDDLQKVIPRFRKIASVGLIQPNEWRDEIHPNAAGFKKVAQKFVATIDKIEKGVIA